MESSNLNNKKIKSCSVFKDHAEVNSMEGKAPMSICVQSLAGDIYKELESLVSMYGNKFLHNLMPLVVTVLENLDSLLADKQDLKLQVAVLEEDNRHLHSEYEREKNGRKTAETKLLRVEDEFDEERKLHVTKQIELESNARVLELKLKNLSDQLSRLEENEHEMNRQYQCLRDRYTCLFRYFAEYVERARNGLHINKCDPPPLASDGFMFSQNPSSTSALHLLDHSLGQTIDTAFPKSCDCCQFNLTLGHENIDFDGTSLLTERQRIMKNILETTPELQDSAGYSAQQLADPSFDEFSQGDFLSEDGHDVKSFDGSCCTPQANPGDTASSDMFSGVTKEINNLIKENQDLVQTKNALNVVTNDLIGRIDDLTCENVRLSSERSVLITNGTGMLVRIKDLERECRRLRQELDSTDLRDSVYSDSLSSDNSANEDEGSPEPLAMRKRFSRVEMARVLLERNYYKEQLIELQDTIRWTEMLRVEQRNRTGSRTFKKSGALWNWFSRLFTPKSRENLSTVVTYQSSASPLTPNNSSHSRSRVENGPVPVHVGSNGSVQTKVASAVPCSNFSPITHHTQNTDRPQRNLVSGRLLRLARQSEWITLRKPSDPAFNTALRMSAPYTCYVRPLSENMPGLRPNSNVYLSSTVWICSVSSKPFKFARSEQPRNSVSDPNPSTVHSLVTIIDADEPTQNLDSFAIPSATVLCMASIPGKEFQLFLEDVCLVYAYHIFLLIATTQYFPLGLSLGNTSDTHSHLKQTESYWKAIPLDLSEELMPFQRRATYPVPGTPFPYISHSACVSTSSVSISTTQHRHPSMMEMGNSLYSVTGSISRTSASNPEGAFSYFVERRKFLVHSGINELERFKSDTSARPEFGLEQPGKCKFANPCIWCATSIYADRTICAPHTSESSWAHTGHPNSNVYLSSTVWICSVSSKPFKFARSEQPRNSVSDPNPSTVHSLVTIIDADEPTQNLDSFAIPSATVLCMASIPGKEFQLFLEDVCLVYAYHIFLLIATTQYFPLGLSLGNTSDTHSHLKQTESYWKAIPLDLSEELMPFQRRATYPVPGTPFPYISHSACVSTSSVSISTTQHRHPSMMEMGNSLYSVTGSISRTSASNPEGAFSYFVERRKFLVHSGINELERFKSDTSARPEFGLEQPGNTSDTHSHLKQTESYWKAIPLDLSEELMPFQRRATYPVPGTPFPYISHSACVSTSSVSISTTQHRHPSMMEMGNSLYSVTGSISRTSASNPEGAFSYFVERRKFLVHSGINELERFKSDTSARPEFGLEQPAGSHTVTSSELPSSSTCPSAPNSVTGSTASPSRPSSAQPTVWIGCYDGTVFVHSSVTKWRHCLHALHLPDSVTQIRHHKGRAFVSLANGQLVVFRRRLHCPQFSSSASTQSAKAILVSSSNLPDSGSRNMSPTSFASGTQAAETVTRSVCSSNEADSFACVWDFTEACVITCDLVRSTARQLIVIPSGDTIWTSCRKRITVIDAVTLQLINSFEVQSEGDVTIRHMTLSDIGVWVGLRNEPTLFLYHTSSHRHLQTVNLEPLISNRLGKL
ncbi:hypothetical protein AHF37_02420 [Paragonimus kellicotti]|nr:hypothetical protein AHF37_02420 [Paragonimus kellicotti]